MGVARPNTLEDLITAARGVWPGVHLPVEAFAAHLRRHQPVDVAALHVEDLYLAAACVGGDAEALRTFDRVFVKSLAPKITAVGLDPQAVDALLQSLRRELLVCSDDGRPPGLAAYRGRGRLSAWLRVVAIRAAIRERERLRWRERTEPVSASMPSPSLDPLILSMRDQLRTPLRAAVTHGIEKLAPRDRRLLQLSILEGLDNRTIAARLGVHESTVSRWLAKAHRALRKSCRHRLQRELAVSPWELDSVLRVFEGHFSVTTGAIWGTR